MIVIGELINSTRKQVRPAIEQRDTEAVQKMARDQAEAGASIIDVNSGAFVQGEAELLVWLVETVQAVVDLPCGLDSPRPAAIEAALRVHKGQPLINSITAETDRMAALLPLIGEYKPKVLCLCMDDSGIPNKTEPRIEIALRLVDVVKAQGVADGDIFVDPCILPVSSPDMEGTSDHPGEIVMRTYRAVREKHPGVHLCGGLSNVSYGLPKRKLVNRAALLCYMAHGMDSAIVDPLDQTMMSLMLAAETILNRDEFCMNYIAADRAERLVV